MKKQTKSKSVGKKKEKGTCCSFHSLADICYLIAPQRSKELKFKNGSKITFGSSKQIFVGAKEYDKGCEHKGGFIINASKGCKSCLDKTVDAFTPPPVSSKCEHSWIQEAPIKVCYRCGFKPNEPSECSPTEEKKDLDWEKEFYNNWGKGAKLGKDLNSPNQWHEDRVQSIVDFIRSLLTKTKEDMIREIEKAIERNTDDFGTFSYDEFGTSMMGIYKELKSKLLKKGRG